MGDGLYAWLRRAHTSPNSTQTSTRQPISISLPIAIAPRWPTPQLTDTLVTEAPWAPDPDLPLAQDVTERFEDQGPLGQGGSSIVRRGLDRGLRRDVALKILRPDGHHGLARFIAEAQITGQLEHPNIVPVHELGVDKQGLPYFAMKLVEGETLEDAIEAAGDQRTSPENLTRFLEILLKICDALAFAHSRKVLHTDIKPANILVGDFGQVYLVDWGLALTENGAEARTTDKPIVVGTPQYMSPEAANGDRGLVDERSDVFCMGSTLFHVLTGTPPFRASNIVAALVQARRNAVPAPSTLQPCIPPGLDEIVLKATARDPSSRYQSVTAFAAAIRRILLGGGLLENVRFAAGETIVREGDLGDVAYLIDEGRCGVYKGLADQSPRCVRELGPGDVFGEASVFSGRPRSASVVALEPVLLRVVTRTALSEGVGLNSWVGSFVRALTERFLAHDARLDELERHHSD